MQEEPPKNSEKEHPDRPLECSECKKIISVHYTEIVGDTCTHTAMCSICPQLQRRLQGIPQEGAGILGTDRTAGLACGECGTSLDSVRVSHTVGCSHCYDVFGDLLVEELLASHSVSPNVTKHKRTVPLHLGRSPGEAQEISPSLKLIALNEALEETLKKEDYEQAAWLRDQIKAITEESEGPDASKK